MSSEAELKSLRATRGRIKSSLTKFAKAVADIQLDPKTIDRAGIIKLEMKIEGLTPKCDEFTMIHYKICDLTGEEDDEELDEFNESFLDAIAKAKSIAEEYYNKQNVEQIQDNTSTITSSNSGDSRALCESKIKLPTIQLPKFNRDSNNWLEFRDIYKSLIHDNNSISDIKKFYYLKSALVDDAKHVIQGLQTADSNYAVAWSSLCGRYENERLLTQNHLGAIFKLPKITRESGSDLRDMIDKVNYNLRALESLAQPVGSWDAMIIYIICSKLDADLTKEWESRQTTQVASLEQLKIFLQERANVYDAMQKRDFGNKGHNQGYNKAKRDYGQNKTFLSSGLRCYYCNKEHTIYNCKDFLELTVKDRISAAKEKQICANCLRIGHEARACAMSGCRKCKKRHNSLLHLEIDKSGDKKEENQEKPRVACQSLQVSKFLMLSTAVVHVYDNKNRVHNCRILLDSCSQPNFIKKSVVKSLGLKIEKTETEVVGINNCSSQITGQCEVDIKSKSSEFTAKVMCLVVPEISEILPQYKIDKEELNIPTHLRLADSNFNEPGAIDMLLGVSIFWDLVKEGRVKLGKRGPSLIETTLGWIVAGNLPDSSYSFLQTSLKCYKSVQVDLEKFWEIEELPAVQPRSKEESFCESNFTETTTRKHDGRFVVKIPWKQPIENLGESKEGAKKRFLALERKLQANTNLKQEYCKFMNEYEKLKHMTRVNVDREKPAKEYFLPHHGVINEASSTTKLRVVFDGSFLSSSGLSRNDIESVGPVVQSDLISILLRFRVCAIAICSDIEKMYRQVEVCEEDRPLQQILWRSDPSEPIEQYELNTVTYGTAASSFLATRCLLELSNEIEKENPELAIVIKEDFYMDDLLTGVDNIEEGRILCKQVNEVLDKACFPLRKWTSNSSEVLSELNDKLEGRKVLFGSNECTKTLGLYWSPCEDYLRFSIEIRKVEAITKRVILSRISQVYDPMGLVSPCVIQAKILLQSLWLLKLDWNTLVPEEVASNWITFYEDLEALNSLRIPRYCLKTNRRELQLHGFSDASEKAYGACVYLRCVDELGKVHVQLLCAKSKVAPLKTITIPKLELCAALVLARLVQKTREALRVSINSIYLWTDSMITLGWIRKPPNLLKIFVANRVVQINHLTSNCQWNHVRTQDNPADLVSRGIMPSELVNTELWWGGPRWLKDNMNEWPETAIPQVEDLPEIRCIKAQVHAVNFKQTLIDCTRFSKFLRLIRTLAYAIRFVNICKTKKKIQGEITSEELSSSTIILIKIIQKEAFENEINILMKNGNITSSKILALAPFLDESSVLRVGGRLANSDLDYEAKHQILLPYNHKFTSLLFDYEHKRLGHAGPQLLLSSIREKYWPIRGKDLARKTVHSCIICYRAKPHNQIPLMGSLPKERTRQSYPFDISGVDYAGPFTILSRKGRGAKTSKCYVALFICFAIKAVHVEVVSDLTTEAFLAALRRFIARRGKPTKIWSDNGTNFAGANNELRGIVANLINDENELLKELSSQGVDWKFIPANSPHFGGLWEAGVKGIKFHLKRLMSTANLTFEELTTVCCQVESILNSRPLCPLSSDPNDLEPLTPGHFLIGRRLTSIPEKDLRECQLNRLSRFQVVQQVTQHFWDRWHLEYLHTLQSRQKWQTTGTNAKEGTMVLIKDDNLPPLRWRLGRIVETIPGKDGQVRVAKVRTTSGTIQRAVAKLYPLPSIDDGNSKI